MGFSGGSYFKTIYVILLVMDYFMMDIILQEVTLTPEENRINCFIVYWHYPFGISCKLYDLYKFINQNKDT